MEGVLRRVLRGVWDDRLGRPTPECFFFKSRVSKQDSVNGGRRKSKRSTPSTGWTVVLLYSVRRYDEIEECEVGGTAFVLNLHSVHI